MEMKFRKVNLEAKFVFRDTKSDPQELKSKVKSGDLKAYDELEIMEELKRLKQFDRLEKFKSAVAYYSIHSWYGGMNADLYEIGILAL